MRTTSLIEYALLLVGAGALIASLVPASRVIRLLPAGKVRQFWCLLFALILCSIVGYLGYGVTHWSRSQDDLLVPTIFLIGGCFVLIVNALSLHTALDVRRVAVLEHETITDHLMGIYNRRYLDRRLEEEAARAQRYGSALSVLMIDIDQFKRINDTYGHRSGDVVLTNLAALIRQTVRKSDLVARYGGEEIVVLAPDTAVSNAARLGENIRQNVESTILVPPDQCKGQTAHITISVGVAELKQGLDSGHALLERADHAMYQAKHAGRNRVAVSDFATKNPPG